MNASKFLKKNGTTLFLVGAGVTGIGSTVAGIAAMPRAMQLAKAEEERKGAKLNKRETVKAAWKPFIPAIALEFAQIGCLVGAGCTSGRQLAAATATIALEQARLDKYIASTKKVIGEEKTKEIKQEAVKEDVATVKSDDPEIINTGDGMELFWDPYCGRPFLSTKDKLRQGLQYVVRELNNEDESNLNTFYYGTNLPSTIVGETHIWRKEDVDLRDFEVTFEPYKTNDGRLCWAYNFSYEPRCEDYRYR